MRIKFWHHIFTHTVLMTVLLNSSNASVKTTKRHVFRWPLQKEPIKDDDEVLEPVMDDVKKGWFSRNPRKECEKKQEEATSGKSRNKKVTEKSETENSTSKGKSLFGRGKKQSEPSKIVDTEKNPIKKENTTNADEKIGLNSTQTNNTIPSEFISEPANQTHTQKTARVPPRARQPLILLNQPNRGMYFQQGPPPFPPGGPIANPGMGQFASNPLVAQALTILYTGLRFWMLTYFPKLFASEKLNYMKEPVQHFIWERLNDRYSVDSKALQMAVKEPPIGVSDRKWRRHLKRTAREEMRGKKKREGKKDKKSKTNEAVIFDRTVVVVDLNQMFGGLQDVVTFIISQHRNKIFGPGTKELEVVLLLNSPGGEVSIFGWGASQLTRLSEEKGITTTACVDTVAASGGYLLASQAHKLVCAPFAHIGSIGVVVELLNYNKVAEKYGISPIIMTAGDAKAPLTQFGEITKSGKQHVQRKLTQTHTAFRECVVQGRPDLADSINEISDGAVYLGQEAKDLKMVDVLMTSEEYIYERVHAGDRVLKLCRMPSKHINVRIPLLSHLLKHTGKLGEVLRNQDIPKLTSRILQAATFFRFANHISLKYNGMP